MEEGKGARYLASGRQYGNALLGVRHQEEKAIHLLPVEHVEILGRLEVSFCSVTQCYCCTLGQINDAAAANDDDDDDDDDDNGDLLAVNTCTNL